MADFEFASANSSRKFPTSTEKQQGMICGPASRDLFNGMFYRLEAELGHLIDYAGLSGDDGDLEQVRKAIQALSPNNTDTFLESINGDTNGGSVAPNSSGKYVFKMSDGITWTLNAGLKPYISNAVVASVSYGGISANQFAEGNYDSGYQDLSISIPSALSSSKYILVQVQMNIRGELNSGQDDMTGFILAQGTAGGAGYGEARVHADALSFDVIGTNAGSFSDATSCLLWVNRATPKIRYRIFRASSSVFSPLNKGAGLYQLTARILGGV